MNLSIVKIKYQKSTKNFLMNTIVFIRLQAPVVFKLVRSYINNNSFINGLKTLFRTIKWFWWL